MRISEVEVMKKLDRLEQIYSKFSDEKKIGKNKKGSSQRKADFEDSPDKVGSFSNSAAALKCGLP
jgi:hypothetical protein